MYKIKNKIAIIIILALSSAKIYSQKITQIKDRLRVDSVLYVGTSTPNTSAVVDIDVTSLPSNKKKGFLGPRVSLSSKNDTNTIPSPAKGLLVYNLGTVPSFTYNGYIFWNGTEWRSLNNSSLDTASLGNIDCSSATMTPNSYTTGTPFTGTVSLPYTGSNGGVMSPVNTGPNNGLTLSHPGGNIPAGSGNLSFTVSGTPTVTTPTTTTFPINVGGKTCNIVIGGGSVLTPGAFQFYTSNLSATVTGIMSNYVSGLPVLGGKIRLDMNFTSSSSCGSGCVSANPRIYNVSSSPVKIWFGALTNVDRFNGANLLIAAGGYVDLDNGIYLNNGYNDISTTTPRSATTPNTADQEMLACDIAFDGVWYRFYYFSTIDNNNTSLNTDDIRKIYMSIQRLSN